MRRNIGFNNPFLRAAWRAVQVRVAINDALKRSHRTKRGHAKDCDCDTCRCADDQLIETGCR